MTEQAMSAIAILDSLKFLRFIKYKLGRKTKVNQMKINMLYNKQLSYICIFSCFT